jgi:NAD-dependent dihydropyrimidine dehydrogenase PreA subunit
MMVREIVKIDEVKCNGCGLCIPNCHEGALQIIDGKARLINELMCDGLGACIGHCPEDAITIERREAENYNEETVISKNSEAPGCGCAGSAPQSFTAASGFKVASASDRLAPLLSELTQWPVQMHLINPGASYFQNTDLLVAADCVAFSHGDFHRTFLTGKKLVIACPKLDQSKETYIRKLIRLVDEAKVNTITVVIMEVPCCGGLVQMVQQAVAMANRKVPVKVIVVSIKGIILEDCWI